jgi:uncharacterized protein
VTGATPSNGAGGAAGAHGAVGADGAGHADGDGWRLRPPAHRIDRRAITWWSVRSVAVTVVLLVPQLVVLAGVIVVTGAGAPLVVSSAITAVLGVTHLVVVPRWRWSTHRWEVTDEAVHTLAGWLRREWRIAPIARIQTVDTEQGPLQRLFGLATVTVTTASASGALRIEGLDVARASDLARGLTRATEAVGGDAT